MIQLNTLTNIYIASYIAQLHVRNTDLPKCFNSDNKKPYSDSEPIGQTLMGEQASYETSSTGNTNFVLLHQVARCSLDAQPKANKFGFGFLSLSSLANLIQARGQSLEQLHEEQNFRFASLLSSLNETDHSLHLQMTSTTTPLNATNKDKSLAQISSQKLLPSPITIENNNNNITSNLLFFNESKFLQHEQSGLVVCRGANALGWQADSSWCLASLFDPNKANSLSKYYNRLGIIIDSDIY